MEHDTKAASSPPAHGDPDDADLEAYGDWVTVDPAPAPSAESSPEADEADAGGAHQQPDTRAVQDLTAAEEALLDQLTESDRAAVAGPAAAPAGPAAGDSYATTAALARLEHQLSALNADLKAVGQQLAELRGRVGEVPDPAAVPGAVDPPPAAAAAAPAQSFEGEAGDDRLAITLEELESPLAPWEATAPAPQAPAVDVAEAPREPRTSAPPDLQESPMAEPEPAPPATISVETLASEDTTAVATAPTAAAGAEVGGQVREDVRSVLAYLDQLLDALPPEKVREFAQSEHFATYKRLFREFDLNDSE